MRLSKYIKLTTFSHFVSKNTIWLQLYFCTMFMYLLCCFIEMYKAISVSEPLYDFIALNTTCKKLLHFKKMQNNYKVTQNHKIIHYNIK